MTPKIKNILIFTAIAIVFVLIYIFFIKPSPAQPSLVSSSANNTPPNTNGSSATTNATGGTADTEDFLALLLNVQGIKLDDSIFSDPSFISLHDTSIILTQDNTEGRPNPFAQFGNDIITPPPATPQLPLHPPIPRSII